MKSGVATGEPQGFSIDRFIAREAEQVERALAQIGTDVSVSPRVRAPLVYALEGRGKRLRPVLCAAAFRAVSGHEPTGAVYRVGCAAELVHTYSLVHDDLPCMDDDDLRRGRPTVHRVFGVGTAVLVGAALLPLAVRTLDDAARVLGLDEAGCSRMVQVLCSAAGAGGMVGGQYRDLRAEGEPVGAASLEAIHRGKTGALLAAALHLGALAARGTPEKSAALVRYGESVGLAFQIVDDLLDVEGDAATLGKTAGRDASLGKSTYPALFGVDGARALAADRTAEALAALQQGGIDSLELTAVAEYVLGRRH